jgi:uncharacterized protein YqgV (UPF0045/DUF77 family)
MVGLAKQLLFYIIGWLLERVADYLSKRAAKQIKKKEKAEETKRLEKKLEEAKSEDEVIRAGSDLLGR